MAYNYVREERKRRIWKENEEKILRECGVDEGVIEEIRALMTDLNSSRLFYRWINNVAEYFKVMAGNEPQAEIHSIDDCWMKSKAKRCIRFCISKSFHTLMFWEKDMDT